MGGKWCEKHRVYELKKKTFFYFDGGGLHQEKKISFLGDSRDSVFFGSNKKLSFFGDSKKKLWFWEGLQLKKKNPEPKKY